MERLTIVIDGFGNATFVEGNESQEAARILRELADKIEAGRQPESLLDINDNSVGRVTYE